MADKRSIESHISADLPIKSKEEDRLNRAGFAEALASVIRSWRDKPSLVIGLFGDWGSGKSSLKNLIIESISEGREESLLVVEFSPWQVSSQELLSETFFREIGKALGKTGPPEETAVKRRVARWKKYAGALSIAATVARAFKSALSPSDHKGLVLAGAATSVESLAAVARTGAEAVEAEAATEMVTLSELKSQIAEDLRSLERPIFVVLDDIDRLNKEEIRYTLQLVKANADFPNIIYLLLAQKKSILDALNEVAPENALAYLEKIIQVSFDVPAINRKQLQDLFLKGLNELLAGPELERRFSREYWGAIFPHLFLLFRNLRDINRFLGALAFHIRLFLNGDTFEVNPIDLIALEAIRLHEPDVYRRISEEKEILTLLPRWPRDRETESEKLRLEELVSLSSEANRDVIRNLMGEIFPPSKLIRRLRLQGDEAESIWFGQLRVCSYQAFDRYFQFATPEGDVSQADIDDLLKKMGDIAGLDHLFARLVERDLLETMLTRISTLKESLPLEHAAIFLAALYQIKTQKRQYGFLESSPQDLIVRITYWYLQRLSQDQRLSVMEEALRLTRGLSLAIRAVGLLTHAPAEDRRFIPFLEEQADRDRLSQAGLEAVVRATFPDSQISPDEVLLTVPFWAAFDHAAAKAWLDAHLTSRSAMVNYLESLVTTSDGTAGLRRFMFVHSFERLFEIEELEAKVDKYLGEDLTGEEADLVRLFRTGVRKRRDGEDSPSLVWMEPDNND